MRKGSEVYLRNERISVGLELGKGGVMCEKPGEVIRGHVT